MLIRCPRCGIRCKSSGTWHCGPGVPAVAVALVVGLLGLWQTAKGWVDFGKGTITAGKNIQANVRQITSERQRAALRLAVCSVLAVAFAYALAVIVDGVVAVAEVNPDALFSSKVVENAVVVTQWSSASVAVMLLGVSGIGLLGFACIANLVGLRKLISFLGTLVCIVAWVGGFGMGADALIGFAILGLHSQDQTSPPLSLLVTQVIVALLLLALGWLLPVIRKAAATAFTARAIQLTDLASRTRGQAPEADLGASQEEMSHPADFLSRTDATLDQVAHSW